MVVDVLVFNVARPFVRWARIKNVNLALALVQFEDLVLEPKVSGTPKTVNEAPTGFSLVMEPFGIADVFGVPPDPYSRD